MHIGLEAEFKEKVAKSGRTQKLLERSGSSTDEVAYNIPRRDQGERERSFTSSSSLIWGSSKHAQYFSLYNVCDTYKAGGAGSPVDARLAALDLDINIAVLYK